MPVKYTVKSGDCPASLSEYYKIPWKKIWHDSANESLRKKRRDSNVLNPGDIIHIPDLESKKESGATEQRHRFRLKLNPIWIRVDVLDILHQPMVNVPYHFVVDGKPKPENQTTEEGLAEVKINKAGSEVVLHLPWGEFPVEQGQLDPANTIKGIRQRLRNLGFDPGGIDGKMGPRTAAAIRMFQECERMKITGLADKDTVKRLRERDEKVVFDGEINQVEDSVDEAVEPIPKHEIDGDIVDYDETPHHLSSADDFWYDPQMFDAGEREPDEEEAQR